MSLTSTERISAERYVLDNTTTEISLHLLDGSVHEIVLQGHKNRSLSFVSTSELFVPERARRNGSGTRLLMAGFALAKSEGIFTSTSFIESPYSLMARRRIFGEQNIQIIEDTDEDLDKLTVKEAIALLEIDKDGRNRLQDGVTVRSDLRQLNTVGWELPVTIPG